MLYICENKLTTSSCKNVSEFHKYNGQEKKNPGDKEYVLKDFKKWSSKAGNTNGRNLGNGRVKWRESMKGVSCGRNSIL